MIPAEMKNQARLALLDLENVILYVFRSDSFENFQYKMNQQITYLPLDGNR